VSCPWHLSLTLLTVFLSMQYDVCFLLPSIRVTSHGKRFFSSPKEPDWLWSPPKLLFRWCPFPGERQRRKAHLHLVWRLRISGTLPPTL